MILEIRPLAAGNALQVTHSFPAGALLCALVRKPTNDISGMADPAALLVYQGEDTVVVDAMTGLVNQQPMFYRAFYFVGGSWQGSTSMSGTPVAVYEDATTDVQGLVRDRLEAAFAVEVARGNFTPKSGAIPVVTAPPMETTATWPIVTVQLESESSGDRGIGELIAPDLYDEVAGDWVEHEGWLADVRLVIGAWCLNPNERISLRKALRRILIANLPVFDAAGMVEISMQFSDADFINGEYSANVFQESVTFSCKAPVIVTAAVPAIATVNVTAIGEMPPVL